MSKRQRLINLGLAAAIAVVAVVVILVTSGGSDDSERSAAAPTPTATPEATVTTSPKASAGEPDADATSTPTVAPQEPEVPSIRTKGGKPVGGIAEFRVEQGERLRFTVTSDVDEEIHVHAYDIYEDVGPGNKARFNFKADITGVIEVELHGSATQIASLRVDP